MHIAYSSIEILATFAILVAQFSKDLLAGLLGGLLTKYFPVYL